MASLKVRASRMTEGRKNLSAISCDHCFRRFAGAITSRRRFRSAHFCARRSPASMVLPSPTSSARISHWKTGCGTQRGRPQPGAGSDRPALGIRQHGRELLHAVGGAATGELEGKVLGMKVGQGHAELAVGSCSGQSPARQPHLGRRKAGQTTWYGNWRLIAADTGRRPS